MAIVLRNKIAEYDDSFNIHSVSGFPPKVEMKKLHHELYIVVEGPDNAVAKAGDCVQRAAGEGLIAAIIAGFIGVGIGGAQAGWGLANARITECLGTGFNVRLDDSNQWIHWTV